MHRPRKLLVPVNAQQSSVHYLAVIFSPVATLLELGPVPARNPLACQALENEQLARFLVLDEHAHVVVVRAGHSTYQLVLHLLAREEEQVTSLRIFEELRARDAAHLPEVDWRLLENFVAALNFRSGLHFRIAHLHVY